VTAAFWYNDLSPVLVLDGEWQFQLASRPPITLPVPSAWEAYIADKVTEGPARYRRNFDLPAAWLNHRIVLEAGAVSYHTTIQLNGQTVDTHVGMWSPFQIDITPFVHAGRNDLALEVWKPGQRFPVREALAGFLPDVCNTFGGAWQSLRLRALSGVTFTHLHWRAGDDGVVHITGHVMSDEPLTHVSLSAEAGQRVEAALTEGRFSAALALTDVPRWMPGTQGARLFTVTVAAHSGARTVASVPRRLGFRRVYATGERTCFNGQPVHFRGVLDWGWNPDTLAPTFTREALSSNFEKARALGFNLWKLCLFVPDETFFDTADEAGMPLWLEMPLWLPHITPEFKAQALREYAAVFQRVHHHPSIAIVSLGCELNAQADGDFLRALHALARDWFPHALICDNSGSAEAYGGVDVPLSDFYDYHFYTDPPFFESLIHHFNRDYRAHKPWLYGEFCDADTLRDYHSAAGNAWWLTHPTTTDHPDHAYQREHRDRLAAAGVSDGGRALTETARSQATAVRKFIFETVRRHNATGGYVITGWRDTPIATSGVVNDDLRLKFNPAEWRAFNTDVVLLIDRERRRRWEGGDRPNPRDPFTWWQGERAEVRVIVSNGSGELAKGELAWSVTDERGEVVASSAQTTPAISGGTVTDVGAIAFMLPEAARPVALALRVQLNAPDGETPRGSLSNQWALWAIPKPKLPPTLALEAPLLHRHRFHAIDKATQFVEPSPTTPLIATELTDALLARLHTGARVLLWLTQPDARFTLSVPFWREAIHVFEPDPVWESIPHPGYADMRFFSIATDFALDMPKLAGVCNAGDSPTPPGRGDWGVREIWRRFDARRMQWAEYIVEARVGSGHLLATTLRFEGGLGGQPVTFQSNPLGAWLFAALVYRLAKMQP
jgi:hypothetical protein